jgi:hypothetical protein
MPGSERAVSGKVLLSWPGRWRTLRHLRANSGGGVSGGLVTAVAVVAYTLELCGRATGGSRPRRREPVPSVGDGQPAPSAHDATT